MPHWRAQSRRVFVRHCAAAVLSGVAAGGRHDAAYGAPQTKPVLQRGGSNFVFFGLDGCNPSRFDVIPSYATAKDIIDQQLEAMYRGGQRRLRIALPIYPNSDMDTSESGILDPAYERLMENFLVNVRQTGFEEIVAFPSDGHPQPWTWESWDEAAYQHRWNWIVGCRRILLGSGLRYRLDLLNEGVPAKNQAMLLHYVQRLWSDYETSFGVADTVGFSIIPDPVQDRFMQIPAVYQGRLPMVLDLHIYDNPIPTILNAHRRLSQLGCADIPWIIGETFYDDPDEARDIASALETVGQDVLFLLQWPLSSAKHCKDVDEAFPARFDNYLAFGF